MHIILAGLLIGNGSYTFNSLFNAIFNGELRLEDASTPIYLPTIYAGHFKTLMTQLLVGQYFSFPPIIAGFDAIGNSLQSMLKELDDMVNPRPPKMEVTLSPEQGSEVAESQSCAESVDPVLAAKTRTLLDAMAVFDVTLLKHFLPETSGDSTAGTVIWPEFLSTNGYQPLYLYVAGPQKCGKSELARALATRMDLFYIDLVGAITFVLQMVESTVSFEATRALLSPTAVLKLQKDLVAAVDAKINEGKKAKDKAPSDGKIDINAVTDALCAALPLHLRQQALCALFRLHPTTRRRGCVWDIWEKGITESVEDIANICKLLNEPAPLIEASSEPNSEEKASEPLKEAPPIHLIIELQADEKWLVNRYNELLTSQQVKAKEAQALVKTFESSLPVYFSHLSPCSGTDLPLSSHSAIRSFIENHSEICVLRPILSPSIGTPDEPFSIMLKAIKSIESFRGSKIGWIAQNEADEQRVEQSPDNIAAEELTGTTAGSLPEVTTDAAISHEESSSDPIDPSLNEKLAYNVDKMTAFLSNTIMPVLTKAVITVMRDRPEDPIMYVANCLLKQSEENQTEATERARKRFYELLNQ
eukprot:gene463-500_t